MNNYKQTANLTKDSDVEIVRVSETPPETTIAFGGKRLELRKNIKTGAWGVLLYLPAGSQDFPEVCRCENERVAHETFATLERDHKLIKVY